MVLISFFERAMLLRYTEALRNDSRSGAHRIAFDVSYSDVQVLMPIDLSIDEAVNDRD